MDFNTFYEYCLSKPGVEETFPFDEKTLVFKVYGKMFALSGLERVPFAMNLKCDPQRAIELREQYEAVQPGYHMSKKHWNTVTGGDELPAALYRELIDHSYDLVYSSLPKKLRDSIENGDQ